MKMKFAYFTMTETNDTNLQNAFVVQEHRSREAMVKHAAKALVSGKRVKVCVRVDAGDEYWFAAHKVELVP